MVPDSRNVFEEHDVAVAGMVVPTALTLKLNQIHCTAVIEIVLRRRIVGLIKERKLKRMLMLAFEALQRQPELPFLDDRTGG
jgi:hypothetical protein